MSKIIQNTTDLQSLLEQVNALPDAGGVNLPSETWILTLEDGSTVEKVVYIGD